jgi:hypothetical protein
MSIKSYCQGEPLKLEYVLGGGGGSADHAGTFFFGFPKFLFMKNILEFKNIVILIDFWEKIKFKGPFGFAFGDLTRCVH